MVGQGARHRDRLGPLGHNVSQHGPTTRDPNGSRVFLRILCTEGRGVRLCWEYRKLKGPGGQASSACAPACVVVTEAGSYVRRVSIDLRLKDLLGPVTRVKKKKREALASRNCTEHRGRLKV